MDWVDKKNFGVSHFSAFPDTYQISNIVYDIFHGRGNIVKLFLRYIRKLFHCNYAALSDFAKLLFRLPEWGLPQVEPWLLQNKVQLLKGKNNKSFTYNIDFIIAKLLSTLPNHMVKSFCDALSVYKEISEMISLVIIDKYENIRKYMTTFNYNNQTDRQHLALEFIRIFCEKVKLFYKHGQDNFLTETSFGDQETFYLHIMR